MATTSTVISERTSYSRKSATYTASTFTAFESYGSTYEYHGLYNTKSEESDDSEGRKTSKEEDHGSEIIDDIDELLDSLNEEELAELAIVDPDDSSVPPDMRCLYHCDKSPSKILDRPQLIQFLREDAFNAPIQEEIVPYIPGEKRGKPYVPQSGLDVDTEKEKCQDINEAEEAVEAQDEMNEFLVNAEMRDLQEIADILGVMYQDNCKADELNYYPEEPVNLIDFNDIIQRIEANDPELKSVTLNNNDLQLSQWQRLFQALKEANSELETLHAANCNLKDSITQMIVEALSTNSTLKVLTLDSNLFSSKSIVDILQAVTMSQSLQELRLNNQINCKKFGHQVEYEIAKLMESCPQLLRLGITLEFRDPLNRVAKQLQRNLAANSTKRS